MKLLLTSAGIKNPCIHNALVELLGKPTAESSALCIPTGMYPFPGLGDVSLTGHRRIVPESFEKSGYGVITIRQLELDELVGVYDINMTESGDILYRVVDGHLERVSEDWHRPPRKTERWDEMIARWRGILEGGGEAWGAFEAGRMVAIAVLRYRLTQDMAELTALFVSRPYRRRGVARRLMQSVLGRAKRSGAARIYVSATPSASAVGFYQSLGFGLAEHVNAELYALEPEDVHMVRVL